jgi:hypothetical protein
MDNEQPAVPVPGHSDVKLPPFWVTRPAAWFRVAESKFRLRNIEDQNVKFDHLLAALPETVVGQILDVIETAPEDTAYDHVKQRLLETHVLSDYEKIDLLVKMEPMGGRKPSQLLAAMMEFCPLGMETHLFFHYLFTQRLPQPLRTQLGEVEAGDPRALAARADKLWAVHAQQPGAVAAVSATTEQEEGGSVAAVSSQRGARGGRGGRGRGRGRGGQHHNSQGNNAGVPAAPLTPSALARSTTGLCHFHWTYAEKANRCEAPCSWGN